MIKQIFYKKLRSNSTMKYISISELEWDVMEASPGLPVKITIEPIMSK